MSPENVLIAFTFSAGFPYLATRLVAAFSRLTHPMRSLDVWVLVALLLLLELTLARMFADAVASRDVGGVALTVGHLVFVIAWLVYLSRVTAKAS